MSGAELPLAIIGTIDLCIKYGGKLIQICAAFRSAGDGIAERILLVEAGWLKTAKQLEFLQKVEHLMDDYHRYINEKCVETLQSKLKTVINKLEGVVKVPDRSHDVTSEASGSLEMEPRRWKYALLKESIDAAIEELQIWQRTADASWYLILKIADVQIDQVLDQVLARDKSATASFPSTRKIRAGLKESNSNNKVIIFLRPDDMGKMEVRDVPLCEAQWATRLSASKGPQHFLLTRMELPPMAAIHTAKRDVRDLARKLQHGSPEDFNLLSCKGVVERVDPAAHPGQQRTTFTMVFRAPSETSNPRSLRDLMVSSSEEGLGLSDKFEMARQMANSVNYVHTFGFVHKNVRPETMVTYSQAGNSAPPSLFLVGFDSFRKDEGKTYRLGDTDWHKNLYRHPSRQGLTPDDDYVMQHDIYSLGVCLLEVGLWKSFVQYDASGRHASPSTALGSNVSIGTSTGASAAMKDHLVSLAQTTLERGMGRKYAAVVETCLTCLDPGNADFGNPHDFADSDGILVGARYIEKVLSQLNAICV